MDREIKEVRIDGAESDWYQQAVFVLKPYMTQKQLPANLIDYADQLIEHHLKLKGKNEKVRNAGYGVQMHKSQTEIKKAKTSNSEKWVDKFLVASVVVLIGTVVVYSVL